MASCAANGTALKKTLSFMNTIDVCFGVFVFLVSTVALFRLYRIRMADPHIATYGSQTMCPSCGSITARSKAHCLRCGKPMREQ
jgi:uncharacterized paraquat-inducible protein A